MAIRGLQSPAARQRTCLFHLHGLAAISPWGERTKTHGAWAPQGDGHLRSCSQERVSVAPGPVCGAGTSSLGDMATTQSGPPLWSSPDKGHSQGSPAEGLRLAPRGRGRAQPPPDATLLKAEAEEGTRVPGGGWKVGAKAAPAVRWSEAPLCRGMGGSDQP